MESMVGQVSNTGSIFYPPIFYRNPHTIVSNLVMQGTDVGLGIISSELSFPSDPSILRLANSSAQPWDFSAILYINNWRGSASGGGETQLFFGTDANGLTSQQLAAIRFSVSGAFYPARLLATGEAVPQGQQLSFSVSGNTLMLAWEPGWVLQSATNVAGPYQDVQDAASPYTPIQESPSQFFRLRQ